MQRARTDGDMIDYGLPVLQEAKKGRVNQRKRAIGSLVLIAGIFIMIMISGMAGSQAAIRTDYTAANLPPSLRHPFGTDWLGRDMMARTMKGLFISLRIGLVASTFSAFIALILGTAAATLGSKVDAMITWLVDLMMGIPHLLLLILISFALGKGTIGVTWALALSHWPSLTRVLRGEILQIRQAPYIAIAAKLGQSRYAIAKRHIFPHIIPQLITGLILLFPHVILHEASITFLGFGLPPEQPGIGNILSESMAYLSMGMWWLAFFPGLLLLLLVILFDYAGQKVRRLVDPVSAQE